jgi:UDP-GlcNAc:undecaprenyl-phosphate GlcNAc-1-phosphate transferase
LLTIPIFDTLTAIVRRKLTGRSIYATDRGHIHHCLLKSGLSTGRALLWLATLCLLAVFGVLASLAASNELFAVVAALTVVGILVVGRLFAYAEFLLIKERLSALWASGLGPGSEKKAHQIAVQLQGSVDWNELWSSLTAAAERLNLSNLCLDVNIPALHEGYHARWSRLDEQETAPALWRVELPLLAGEYPVGRLEIAGSRDGEPMADKVAVLADLAAQIEKSVCRLTNPSQAPLAGALCANGHTSPAAPSANGYHVEPVQPDCHTASPRAESPSPP